MTAHSESKVNQLTDHLFRHEAGRMVSVLTRLFGLHNGDLVEDIVQEAFAKALNEWRFNIPERPSAWLMHVAKNKAIDVLRRRRHEILAGGTREPFSTIPQEVPDIENMFLDHEIEDSRLRMIFACCHPVLDRADQLALTLKTCSGFSVPEIAQALLANVEQVKKRLQRARGRLIEKKIALEIPTGGELKNRLEAVLQSLYLMFNEGYNSSVKEQLIRKDLCQEALRLSLLLSQHPLTRTTKTDALVALLTLLCSRFEARLDDRAEIILLEDQDRTRWDYDLISIGLQYLERSMSGEDISEYHLQAAIVAEHSIAKTFEETNWANILHLYELLARQDNSPVILLNRAIVIGKIRGPEDAIREIRLIPEIDKLIDSRHLFSAVLAEMYKQSGETVQALALFRKAVAQTQSPAEKKLLSRKIAALEAEGDRL